jgi:hypothetical protein
MTSTLEITSEYHQPKKQKTTEDEEKEQYDFCTIPSHLHTKSHSVDSARHRNFSIMIEIKNSESVSKLYLCSTKHVKSKEAVQHMKRKLPTEIVDPRVSSDRNSLNQEQEKVVLCIMGKDCSFGYKGKPAFIRKCINLYLNTPRSSESPLYLGSACSWQCLVTALGKRTSDTMMRTWISAARQKGTYSIGVIDENGSIDPFEKYSHDSQNDE